MKRLIAAALAAFFTSSVYAEDKFLHFQFNKNVVITISNVACPVKKLKNDFPFAVVASRKDGQQLFGCFTHKGDDIVIQWAGGDQTVLPANAFLVGAPEVEPTL